MLFTVKNWKSLKLPLFTFSGALILMTLSVIRFAPFPYRSLQGWNTDHCSHWMSAIAFAQKGLKIFDRPIREVCEPLKNETISRWVEQYQVPQIHRYLACQIGQDSKNERVLFINWSNTPRPYPIGVLLYSLPSALLYVSGASFDQANSVITVQYLITATILACLLWALGVSTATSPFWRVFFRVAVGFLSLDLLLWAAIGIYDSISILFVILSAYFSFRKKLPLRGAFFWGIAVFLHYRALWYFPIPLWSFWEGYLKPIIQKRQNPTNESRSWLWSAIALSALSLMTFLLSFPFMRKMDVNNLHHWSQFTLADDQSLLLLLALIAATSTSVLLRYQKTVTVLLSLSLFLVMTPEVRPWHELFLIPLVFLPYLEDQKEKGLIVTLMVAGYVIALKAYFFKSGFFLIQELFRIMASW
ncbi:MAG: hypothetical protein RJB38_2228 [Pseudomonadota bacterium]